MNVELRPRGLEEVITYFHKTDDPEINALLPKTVMTLEQAIDNYQKSLLPGSSSCGRSIYADGIHAGDVWCYCLDPGGAPEAMLSYCIFEKSLWGRGIATKAVALFLEEIRQRFHLETIGAFCWSRNAASIRVLERSGFRPVEHFTEGGVESIYFELHMDRKGL